MEGVEIPLPLQGLHIAVVKFLPIPSEKPCEVTEEIVGQFRFLFSVAPSQLWSWTGQPPLYVLWLHT